MSPDQILEALRKMDQKAQVTSEQEPPFSIFGQAADEIERLRAKSAEGCLRKLEHHAHRYLWLKKIGCDAALEVIKCWETDVWDEKIDKARGHGR